MKNLFFVSIFLLVSCHRNVETNLDSSKVDLLIELSKTNSNKAVEVSKQGDSAITQKVDKTVEKISNLENQVSSLQNEVKKLKTENNELKNMVDAAYDDGNGYNIRAISDY